MHVWQNTVNLLKIHKGINSTRNFPLQIHITVATSVPNLLQQLTTPSMRTSETKLFGSFSYFPPKFVDV